MTTRLSCVCRIALLAPLLGTAEAQVIRVKTIPVAESEQFSFFPSAGLAGVSLALVESRLDPFGNPAAAASLRAPYYYGAPSFYSVSGNSGAGTTLPVGAVWKKGSSFGGLGVAFQQINRPNNNDFFGGPVVLDSRIGPAESTSPNHSNRYTFAMLGHTLDSARLSIAGSAFWSGLNVVEGVDQFYAGSQRLHQQGEALDLRLGLVKEWGGARGQTLEVVALRNRFGNSHDVDFMDLFWDPGTRTVVQQPRTEHNAERTTTWGVHLEYDRPLADSGWRIGALATANRISQPRIPSYEILSGMGHSGRASAFNLGLGIGRSRGAVSYGLDAIYEPISSKTWVSDSLENRFRFSNAKLRAGISRTFAMLAPETSVRLHFGAELYSIQYVRNQHDRVQDIGRVHQKAWTERTRTAGMSFLFPGLELHYQLKSRSGVGRPGVIDQQNGIVPGPLDLSIAPWTPPISSASTLGAVNVTWHQISVTLPRR